MVCVRDAEIKKKKQGLWLLLFRVLNIKRHWEMTHIVTSMIGQHSIVQDE